jgi:type II secretory pathway pseudopilin PulG
MRRGLDWVSDHLAIISFLLLIVLTGWYFQSRESEAAKNRAAVCSGFEAFTNSLIAVSEPSPDTTQAQRQARIDAFEQDLEHRLGPLGCDFLLIPAR